MLGRRAAVAGTLFVLLLALIGGSAFAATRGSSHSAKPKVHNVVNKPLQVAPKVVFSGHHCHQSGAAVDPASL